MNIDDYVGYLKGAISACPIITAYVLSIDRKTEDIAFIYGALEFRDGSILDFKEFVESRDTVAKFKYAYNYRAPSDLIFRFDNAPDPRAIGLPSFPHHKHQSDGVIMASSEITLSDVLSMIEDIMLRV